MTRFKPFRSFQKSTATLDIRPRKTRSRFRASSTSFLSSFSNVAQTYRRRAILQARRISAYLPQLQTLSLAKDIKLEVPNLIQGHNECGPTSLAMIMQYYGINPGNYHEMFSSDTVGHGPLALRRKARGKNMIVRQENYGSLEDLAALIDKGIPPMVLGIYGGGSNSSVSDYIENASRAHWMTVTGYKKNDTGQISHVYFNNPNQSSTQCWTASRFKNEFWNNNIIPGGHRYYMAMAKPGTFQETLLRSYLPSDKISSYFESMLGIIDGLETAFYEAESWLDGLFDFFGDVADAVDDAADAVGDAADAVGDAVGDAADAVGDAAEDVWDEISSWF